MPTIVAGQYRMQQSALDTIAHVRDRSMSPSERRIRFCLRTWSSNDSGSIGIVGRTGDRWSLRLLRQIRTKSLCCSCFRRTAPASAMADHSRSVGLHMPLKVSGSRRCVTTAFYRTLVRARSGVLAHVDLQVTRL